jgi:hypothetical protein
MNPACASKGYLKMEIISQVSGFEKMDIDSIGRDRIFSNRKDFKYLFGMIELSRILSEMQKDYVLMTVDDVVQHEYHTHYFDTADLRFYNDHHNGMLNRMKVRIRHYADGKAFVEVKKKNNRGLTFKKRIPLDGIPVGDIFENEWMPMLDLPEHLQLELQLRVSYKRLTFYSWTWDEKVTIDTDLSYCRENCIDNILSVVIAESKGNDHQHSPFNMLMRSERIRRTSFSKYCYGLSLLEPSVKKNNFKVLHHKALKIANAYELA